MFGRSLRLLLLSLILASCGTLAPPAGTDLPQANREFLQRLRWQDFPGAARFLAEPLREGFLERMRSQPDLRIVEVRLETLDAGPGEQRGTSRAEIQYHVLPSITVHSRILTQEWQLLPEPGQPLPQWRVVSPFPTLARPEPSGPDEEK